MSEHNVEFAAAFSDRYALFRELGRGGMARVWLAHDRRDGCDVALKILEPELVQSLGTDRFVREIGIATSLHHPNILTLCESGAVGGFLYYSMPYVAGGSLRDRLRQEIQLPLEDALRIAAEVADALAFAHDRGVVHRDIKPENILLDNGRALVADFGIARAIATAGTQPLTGTGLTVGTPAYMSPEQAGGSARLDGRSDIYALGCVLFEMIAGEPPFSAPTPQALAAKHLNSPVPRVRLTRATVPVAVERVIGRALAKVPADRFRSGRDFAQVLRAASTARAPSKSRWWLLTLPFLVAAASLLSRDVRESVEALAPSRESRPPKLPAGPPRIAVLYFDALSSDSSLRVLADGLTEELIHELSGVNAFKVVSRNGVRPYRDRQIPFDSMIGALRVNTVVDGSVQRLDSAVRVRVQVIDAPTDTYLDSLSVERPIRDLVTFQRMMAQELAAALRRQLGREARLLGDYEEGGTPRAQELVRRARREREDARQMSEGGNPEDLRSAREALRRADSLLDVAVRMDRTWLRPRLDRVWVASTQARMLGGQDRVTEVRRGLRLAEEAIRDEPGNVEGLELRSTLRWQLISETDVPNDTAEVRAVERDLRTVLDRDSTRTNAWATLSYVLWWQGRLAEASIAGRRALREDSYLTNAREVLTQLFFNDLWLGNFAQAANWCERGRLSFPGDWQFIECQLTLMRHNARAEPNPDSAWALVRTLEDLDPREAGRLEGRPYHSIYRRIVAATISARAGDIATARAELARALGETADDASLRLDLSYDEAYLRLVLGDQRQAVSLLRRLVQARPFQGPILARDPLLSNLRQQFPTLFTSAPPSSR